MTDILAPDPRLGLYQRLRAAAPFVIVVLLFAGGLYALHKILVPVDLRAVVSQAKSIPIHTLLIAFAATLGGYAALIGYDWSALRYL